ncbi:hypothetical protein [Martelella sp. FOR1707]
MPANKYNLTTAGKTVALTNTRMVGMKYYATDDTVAEVTAAGYFNPSRADLSVNTLIVADCDLDGTPALAMLRVTAVPATGNVTTAIVDWTASS